jgi:ParB-like chromosome segregation protein Spo0J
VRTTLAPSPTGTVFTVPLLVLLATHTNRDRRGWDVEFAHLRSREHPALAALTASVRGLGITTPIVLGTHQVLDGHLRLCVAYDLGLYQVPARYNA